MMQKKKTHNVLWGQGVTLVEMVVAISLMTVALTAMVPLLRSIQNSWDSRQGAAEVLQNGRVLSDHLYRQLATAIQITDVSADSDASGHIEFVDSDGVTRRYEIGDDGYVRFGAVGSLCDLAGPVSRFQFACYDGNDFSTPTVEAASIRFVANDTTFANTAALGSDKTMTTDVYIRAGQIGEEEAEFESHIALKDNIIVAGLNMLVDSYRSSVGSYDAGNAGSDAVISTNDDANFSVLIGIFGTVKGDAYIGPGGDPDKGIVVGFASDLIGEKRELEAEVDIPDVSAPTSLDRYTLGDGPGNSRAARSILLSGGSTETISSDWEIFEIQLEDDSTLIIEGDVTLAVTHTFAMSDYAELEISTDSSLTLYVGQTFDVSGDAALNQSTEDPSVLRVYITGSNKDFGMQDDAVAYAVLQNPRGDVRLERDTEFFGKLKAENLYSSGKIHVDLDCTFDSGGD